MYGLFQQWSELHWGPQLSRDEGCDNFSDILAEFKSIIKTCAC